MCMVDGGDDTWVPLPSTIQRANKEHKCLECQRTIAKGEHYEKSAGISDGQYYNSKTCAHCMVAREWLLVVCNGFLYEGVLEDLQEHWDEQWEVRSWWLGRIVQRMNRRWTRRDGTLMPVPNACPREWTRGLLEKAA